MNLRDQVNYRNRSFTEPTNQHFYASLFDKSKLIAQIETYIDDEDFVYCFDSDHAALAAPLKLLEKVKNELKSFRGQTYLNSDKKMEIEKILSSVKFTKSAKIRELFDI